MQDQLVSMGIRFDDGVVGVADKSGVGRAALGVMFFLFRLCWTLLVLLLDIITLGALDWNRQKDQATIERAIRNSRR